MHCKIYHIIYWPQTQSLTTDGPMADTCIGRGLIRNVITNFDMYCWFYYTFEFRRVSFIFMWKKEHLKVFYPNLQTAYFRHSNVLRRHLYWNVRIMTSWFRFQICTEKDNNIWCISNKKFEVVRERCNKGC